MLPIITAFLILGASPAHAQDSATPTVKVPVDTLTQTPKKKGLNTDLFEGDEQPKDEDAGLKNITAKVKVVREESDGVEVFFEGDKNTGTFFLHRAVPHYAKALKDLEASKKPQGNPVTISFTEDKKIKKVELQKETGKQIPKDPNQKWDLSL